ncbi:uncharacterized protein LOC126474842 [Schistocerca serialis cubense]|uniref:uncharacterized protein LOC126474842 n=1 Tax=Schistocerca serialis cubense TaxID=2023355 RepID=UPI00214E1AC2|nr:uncharacterized protein LOC126474842 [Schistocerca serialis cubense]
MTGKGREIVDMMQWRKIKALCVQETRWKGNKAKILAEGYKLFYSSESPESRNGFGVILHRELQEEEFGEKVLGKVELAESVQEWWKINSAVIRKTGEEVFGLTSGRGVPKDKEAWWWNEEVLKVVKEKKDAKRKWDVSRSAEDGQAYKSAKKEAKRAVAKAKAESVREAYEQLQKNQDMRQLIRIGKSRDKASKDLTAIKQMKDETYISA